MANSYLSISSMPEFYSLICSYFVLFFSCIFSRNLYVSNLVKIMNILLHHLFITISLYHNFTPTLSQQHGSGFVVSTYYSGGRVRHEFSEEIEEFQNVLECLKVEACEGVSREILNNYLEDVHKAVVEAEEEETRLRGGGGYGSSKIGCTREGEEWKTTLAWELLEERHYNAGEGEEGMDWLWEAFEADSIKSRRIDVVVEEKDIEKKTSGEGDKKCVEEDEQVEMRNGCLQGFRCCSARRGGRRSNSIVKISKPLEMITWWRHFNTRIAKTKRLISDYE